MPSKILAKTPSKLAIPKAKMPKMKGSSTTKINLKFNQKGGDGCPEGAVLCIESTATLVIIFLIGAIIGMFVYFKFYDPYVKNKDLEGQIQQIQQQTQQLAQQQSKNTENMESVVVNANYPTQQQYVVKKEVERLINPLLPPERTYVPNMTGIPLSVGLPSVQIPTRGFVGGYQQVGLLYKKDVTNPESNSETNILPLFGRPTYTNSSRWNYYTASDKFHSLKIPMKVKGRDSLDENGCDELFTDDVVNVHPYNGEFKVTIYGYDTPKYLPQIL
jgi:hypothetical protein